MSDNPNLQCTRCGQWSHLHKADGEQNHFPGYVSPSILVEIYNDVCRRCDKELNAISRDLELAYKAGRGSAL